MEVEMTDLLEKALSEVEKLPPAEQDAVDAILLQELATKHRWAESFANSQDALEKLAEVYLGPHIGGGIEGWFAYMMALLFLLVRPEGLFGEKRIDRV